MLLLIKNSLETSMYWHETEIKTPADLSIGFNMYNKDNVEIKSKDIPTSVTKLTEKLQEVYIGLRRVSKISQENCVLS